MFGGAGISSVSSAQLKRGGGGIEHSNVGLGGGSTTDGGCGTTVAWGSTVPVAVEGARGVETARLRVSWDELGCTGIDGGVDGEQGVLTGVDGLVGDLAGV
jgi:hypothetical protein